MSTYYPQILFEPGFFPNLFHTLGPITDPFQGALAVEKVLVAYFGIETAYANLQQSIHTQEVLGLFQKRILQKTIAHTFHSDNVQNLQASHFEAFLRCHDHAIAKRALESLTPDIALYCAWRLWSSHAPPRGIFTLPSKPPEAYPFPNVRSYKRYDFNLCDHQPTFDESYLQAAYCLYCHKTAKDTCRTGLGTDKPGCPLDLPISEMNWLYANGHPLAALALVIAKNPMIMATGHRICNDCRQSCIYQKQDPVDIPAIESQVVRACLDLPWGFEIMYLLSYANPLKAWYGQEPWPLNHQGRTVLVVGLGPAGFTVAHQLLTLGHHVVAIEALPVRPLISPWLTQPLEAFHLLEKPLEDRLAQGFGGVMEYGITARWNKNFLGAIRLMLERHPRFKLVGSCFFGQAFGYKEALAQGFDHIVLATGAGKPRLPSIKNNLAKGVRMAADFLMTLHQEGPRALKLKAPVVVIGGGLTAMDAATEAQVLLHKQTTGMSEGEKERRVTVLYRQSFHQAPSLRENAPEVKEALAQGIQIQDHLTPLSFEVDATGYVTGVYCRTEGGKDVIIPAGSVILATGTLDHSTSEEEPESKISRIGDLDPNHKGSVVKAIASAMKAVPAIHETLLTGPESVKAMEVTETFTAQTTATLKEVQEIAPGIYDVTLHAPLAACMFQPGQFFKIGFPGFKPLALSGVKTNGALITLIVTGKGPASAHLCQLPLNTPVPLMGPLGQPTFIPNHKRVLLVGQGLGHAILWPVLKAMKQAGCYVDYKAHDLSFYHKDIQETVDSFESLPSDFTIRPLDFSKPWDHALIIGLPAFMDYFSKAIVQISPKTQVMVAVNAPMLCMMQGVCGRCLQRQVHKGQERWVFTCAQQDQEATWVDFKFLEERWAYNKDINLTFTDQRS